MLGLPILFLSLAAGIPGPSSGPPTNKPAGEWTATWTSGIAQRMQLSLGGTFGRGPAQQNRLTLTRTNVFRARDTLQFYGWGTTDLRSANTDFEAGVRYRTPLRKLAGGTLIGGTGLEHWNFPSVLGGTKDLALDSYLAWAGGETFPVTISANGKTLLVSDLPRGTFLCLQALHTQRLFTTHGVAFAVQHGPSYVYSWHLYGKDGNRVLRYYGTLLASRGRWTAELMFRPQAGLQPRIPDNRYWSASITRRFGGR
ncbi:MAG: hypothetical protein SFV54_27395 [Bryobacteraceae bacterium]|nr:hypothetical protein [Bryobacteraceae bacterium]